MKNDPPCPEQEWVSCRKGELSQFAFDNALQSRRQAMARISTGIVTIAAAATAGVIFWSTNDTKTVNEADLPPISCRMVLGLLPKYVGNGIGDHVLVARIDRHLSHCNYCSNRHSKLSG